MIRIITIGDLHGSPVWKTIRPADWEYMVFIGDYVDSFGLADEQILANLQEIIELKKQMPEKVILLWGNHDLCYLFSDNKFHYASGMRLTMLLALNTIFTSNRNLFQAAFGIKNYLWTHAGAGQKWYYQYIKNKITPSDRDIPTTLNRLFDEYYLPLFYIGRIRGGLHDTGGIFWAHSHETEYGPLPGYHQIIGHTRTMRGIVVSDHYGNNTSVTRVDCLDTETEFYQLVINTRRKT
jgi:predicted MPP superfamily phosphohydrolase